MEVGRCRCVCKPWRRMIGSRPFLESYRERQRGLLIYWSERINGVDRLRFLHCPFRRLKEPLEEFIPLQKLDVEAETPDSPLHHTQLVNGLMCVSNWDDSLTLHNICTGEMMELPVPLTLTLAARDLRYSTYHLGYDRESREYKLLRLVIMHSWESGLSSVQLQEAHILTLRPPSGSLPSRWKVLDNDAAGLSVHNFVGSGFTGVLEARTCCSDGLLCWVPKSLVEIALCERLHCYDSSCERLHCYDFSRERFWSVEFPPDKTLGNFLAVARFNKTLALWGKEDGSKVVSYVVKDYGKNWSRQSVQVSKRFEGFVAASGKLPGSSSSSNES